MTTTAKAVRTTRSKATTKPFAVPSTTVDVAILTLRDDALQVLLVRRADEAADEPFPGRWALPGGFVDVDRDADLLACAKRKLLEKTGVRTPYLEQVGSWGDAKRDPRGWSATHLYFALLPSLDLRLVEGGNAAAVEWVDVDDAERRLRAVFDHQRLLRAALERLRSKVEYTSLPAFLLAEPFTLPQLQRAYEVVLGRPVDKSGFRTRMLAADFLDEAGYLDGDSKRPAMGYRVRDRESATVFPRTFSPRG